MENRVSIKHTLYILISYRNINIIDATAIIYAYQKAFPQSIFDYSILITHIDYLITLSNNLISNKTHQFIQQLLQFIPNDHYLFQLYQQKIKNKNN